MENLKKKENNNSKVKTMLFMAADYLHASYRLRKCFPWGSFSWNLTRTYAGKSEVRRQQIKKSND